MLFSEPSRPPGAASSPQSSITTGGIGRPCLFTGRLQIWSIRSMPSITLPKATTWLFREGEGPVQIKNLNCKLRMGLTLATGLKTFCHMSLAKSYYSLAPHFPRSINDGRQRAPAVLNWALLFGERRAQGSNAACSIPLLNMKGQQL